jgi:hypothetical protein
LILRKEGMGLPPLPTQAVWSVCVRVRAWFIVYIVFISIHVEAILTGSGFMWFWVEHEVISCRVECGVSERSGANGGWRRAGRRCESKVDGDRHATNVIEICACERDVGESNLGDKTEETCGGEKKNL